MLPPNQQVKALNENDILLLMDRKGDSERGNDGQPHFEGQMGTHETSISPISGIGSQVTIN
jgi:hypothetical protein